MRRARLAGIVLAAGLLVPLTGCKGESVVHHCGPGGKKIHICGQHKKPKAPKAPQSKKPKSKKTHGKYYDCDKTISGQYNCKEKGKSDRVVVDHP